MTLQEKGASESMHVYIKAFYVGNDSFKDGKDESKVSFWNNHPISINTCMTSKWRISKFILLSYIRSINHLESFNFTKRSLKLLYADLMALKEVCQKPFKKLFVMRSNNILKIVYNTPGHCILLIIPNNFYCYFDD